MKKPLLITTTLALIFLLTLAGCNTAQAVPQLEAQTMNEVTAIIPATAAVSKPAVMITTSVPVGESNPTAVETQVPASPTADLRLTPGEWRTWPVIPDHISQRAIDIYQQGLAMGTDPHAFSITGDCQAIKDVFFGDFDDPRKYYLATDKTYLQETIDNFQGSFNRDGTATRGGFTVASILSPLHADPDFCQPGETPLGCEFRLHNPSILLITLEVWRDPATVDRYEVYLRQVLDESIAHGVLPILITKADKAESLEHVINPTLAGLAYEYDLPLINFWRAAQSLENKGLDPSRDAFHLSPEGWKVKSYTALEGLDTVWRAVSKNRLPAMAETIEATITPQPTMDEQLPELAAGITCEGECLLFSVVERDGQSLKPRGVYRYELSTGQTVEVLPAGYSLQAVSPQSDALLVNHGGELYLLYSNGEPAQLLSSDYFAESPAGAVFLTGINKVAFIEGETYVNRLVVFETGAENPIELDTAAALPYQLYGKPGDGFLYWAEAACDASRGCELGGVWRSDLNTNSSTPVDGVMNPLFSPDGLSMAFMDPAYNAEFENEFNNLLLVEKLQEGLISRRAFYFPPANGFKVRHRLESYAWSPNSSRLAVILDERSNYYERGGQLKLFIIHLDSGMMLDYERQYGLQPLQAWSLDGEKLAYSLMEHNEETGFSIRLVILQPSTRQVTVHDGFEWNSSEFIYIDRIYWMKSAQ